MRIGPPVRCRPPAAHISDALLNVTTHPWSCSAHSNQLNAARITLLKAQDEHLQGIFAKVKSALESVTKDNSKYKGIVEKLLLQGMLALCEKNIMVYCRKADTGVVKGVFASAIAECKKQTGIDSKLTLSETDFLPDTCGGGVELKVMNGQIKCTNTLENRLDNACLQTLPVHTAATTCRPWMLPFDISCLVIRPY